ncbi:MAG: fused MFS/spermidine synthase [bacterium]
MKGMASLKKQISYVIGSFLAGFSVMTVELVSSRIVAPIIGSSVFTWTSVIGITLAGLSIGSWLGGKLADRAKHAEILPLSFLASSVLVSVIPVLSKHTDFITGASDSMLGLNLFISLYLFLLPALSIGLIQPLILKKYATDFSTIGSRYGLLSAVWSAGSLIGVFMTGFFFISHIGSGATIWLTAAILFLTGLCFAFSQKKTLNFFLIAAIIVPLALWSFKRNEYAEKNVVFHGETDYYDAKVVDTYLSSLGESRILFLDFDSHSVDTDEVSPYLYTEMYPAFRDIKPGIKSILAIGAGAYTMPEHFKEYYKDADVSVIETDPEIEQIGKDYFKLGDYDIKTTVGDARLVLKRDPKKYDVIFGDAYNSFISVPWYLLTKEWNDVAREKLTDGGMYAINFIGSLEGENSRFALAVLNTFRKSFPNFYAFTFGASPGDAQNIVFIGVKGDLPMSESALKEKLAQGRNGFLADRLAPAALFDNDQSLILTDDFSPVEKLMAPMMKEYFPKNLSFMKEISNS